MEFVAYNRMKYKGQNISRGHPFRAYVLDAKTKSEAMKKAKRENAEWNKKMGKGKYVTKTVKVVPRKKLKRR